MKNSPLGTLSVCCVPSRLVVELIALRPVAPRAAAQQPELAATIHCEQSPDYHPEGSVFKHLLLMLKQMPAGVDPLVPWAVLMHDIAKPLTASRDAKTGSIHFYEHEKVGASMTESILGRLRFPRKQIEG